jgi:hypothetical protein
MRLLQLLCSIDAVAAEEEGGLAAVPEVLSA